MILPFEYLLSFLFINTMYNNNAQVSLSNEEDRATGTLKYEYTIRLNKTNNRNVRAARNSVDLLDAFYKATSQKQTNKQNKNKNINLRLRRQREPIAVNISFPIIFA